MADLKALLSRIARMDGIRAAVVVSRDGFVIESAAGSYDIDTEAIGAIISTGIGITEDMGKELRVGALVQSMIEYDDGIVVMTLLGNEAVLAVTANLKVNLGNLRYQVKKIAPELHKTL
jgi:hypothetical protein